MDDTPRSPDALDELISAALDGEATAEERARIDADPELRERLAAAERVRAALRSLDPVDDDERESAIHAALAAFSPTAIAPAVVAPTVDLDARRRRRAERSRRLVTWAGAAAAALVLGVVVTNLGQGGEDDSSDASASDTTAAAAASSKVGDDSLSAIPGGAEVAADGGAATTAAAAADTTALESASVFAAPNVSTADELIAYVEGRTVAGDDAGAQSLPTAENPVGADGTELICTLPGGAPSQIAGSLSWQGTPGVLLLVPDAAAPTKAVILSADCRTQLFSVDLP